MAKSEHDELDSDFEYEPDEEDQDKDSMQVRGILDPPGATCLTTKSLHGPSLLTLTRSSVYSTPTALIHEGLIDLNPPYQRGTTPPPVSTATTPELLSRCGMA